MAHIPPPLPADPLVSVIIPIYKVEDYLDECVHSVRAQTYTNLEIILVDDGSPDNCGSMCDAYASEDPRIRVIHRENGGLSAARNSGLDIATGDFITFVDSDDWIYEKTIEEYMSCFAQTPELEMVESRIYPSSYGAPCYVGEYRPDPELEGKTLTGEEVLQSMCLKVFPVCTFPVAWNKCYRRELIGDLRFPEGRIFEDLDFQLRLYPRVRAYRLSGLVTYYYREDREGAITARNNSLKIIPKFHDLYANLKDLLQEVEAEPSDKWGLVDKESYRIYIASLFQTLMMNPLHVDRTRSLEIRKALAEVQRPYAKLLKSYPYRSFYAEREREARIFRFSYDFYLFAYLPLLALYRRGRGKLAAILGRA